MAEIYLGKQTGEDGFQRVCCIKRILPHFAQDNEFITMFRDEAHICKRLQHANIVRVEGFEEVEGSYAIIMEFINGGDLRAVLSACEKANAKLSIAMCLHIIAEAARGLHYAHCKVDEMNDRPLEIVHRDISPQNILLSFEGEVKVTDFGIADADSKATETKPGIVKGKYSYMSPEQISAKTVDARTDVFALSIVLWEMLAMRRLFQGDNEVMTIQKVRSCQIDFDLRALNEDVDEELFEIISKGLRKDQRERYASAAEMERALRKYLSKHFAGFTMSDLGDFLKSIMSARKDEMQEEIRNLLALEVESEDDGESTTIMQPGMPLAMPAGMQSPSPPSGGEVDLSLDNLAEAPSFELKSGTQVPGKNLHPQSPGTPGPLSGGSTGVSRNSTGLNNAGALGGHTGHMQRSARASGAYTNVGAGTRLPQNLAGASPGASRKSQTVRSKPGSRKGTFLLAIVLIGVFGAIGYIVHKKQLFTSSPEEVEVLVTPAVIKIALDGKPLFGDRYIETPVKIVSVGGKNRYIIRNRQYKEGPFTFNDNKEKGFHQLLFRRTGYSNEAFEFNKVGDIGKKYIVLERVTDMAPTRISLVNEGKSVWIKVDDGEVMGQLDSAKPLDANDITFGTTHKLSVYPFGFQSRKGAFVCKFSPRAQNWSAPYLVNINIEEKKCDYPPR